MQKKLSNTKKTFEPKVIVGVGVCKVDSELDSELKSWGLAPIPHSTLYEYNFDLCLALSEIIPHLYE